MRSVALRIRTAGQSGFLTRGRPHGECRKSLGRFASREGVRVEEAAGRLDGPRDLAEVLETAVLDGVSNHGLLGRGSGAQRIDERQRWLAFREVAPAVLSQPLAHRTI